MRTAYTRGFVAGCLYVTKLIDADVLRDVAAMAASGRTITGEELPTDTPAEWTAEELRAERARLTEFLDGADYFESKHTPDSPEAREAAALARVPAHLREGLLRYLDEHIQPGSFLTCVLQNDLRGAMERADAGSRAGLYDVVFFLYNHAPVGAWGDKKAVERWCTPAIPLLSPPTLGEELGHAEDGTVMCPGCGGRHPLHGVVWDCCLPPAYGGLGNTKTKHTVLYVWCGRTRLIPLAIDGKELP